MRHRFPSSRVMTMVTILALAALPCGASPQEGRVPRPQSQPSHDVPVPRPVEPSPKVREPEGRVPRPELRQRSLDPARPSGGMRISGVTLLPGTRLVVPPAWLRRTHVPDAGYWGHRDLMAEIQWLARRGWIPVTPLGDGVEALTDFSQQPAGWRAYGLVVPAGGTVQVEVQHEKLGWFRLMLVNKWGQPGAGMMRAAMAPQPVLVAYKNPGTEATAIYVIVDDPGWWSDAKSPYTLLVRRDWNPAEVDLSAVKIAAGLWGASPSVSAQFGRPTLTGPAVYPR